MCEGIEPCWQHGGSITWGATETYHGELYNHEIMNVPKNTNVQEMHMISLQDSGESGDEVQDEITTIKHLVTCTMLVDTTVQNKKSSWLLNAILDISGTANIING